MVPKDTDLLMSFKKKCLVSWDCMLTEQERTDLSRVLKTGLHTIWGAEYTTLEDILHRSKLNDLQTVRDNIVRKLIRKSEQHGKFAEWFAPQDPSRVVTLSARTK